MINKKIRVPKNTNFFTDIAKIISYVPKLKQ